MAGISAGISCFGVTRAIADPFVRRDNDRACTSWDGWHHSAVPFGGTRLTICDVRFHGKYRGITGLIAEAVKTALMTSSGHLAVTSVISSAG